LQKRRQVVAIFTAFFFFEMKQPGIVFLVRFIEKVEQPLVKYFSPVAQRHQSALSLHSPILTDAKKHDPVDRLLNGEVQFPLEKVRIPQGNVAGQEFPPVLNLMQESGINLGGAFLPLLDLTYLSKEPFRMASLEKNAGEFFPPVLIIRVFEIKDAGV